MFRRARRDERSVAFAVCLGAGFVTLLSVSIINVAIPPIDVALGAGPAAIQWIVAGFTLAFGLVLIPAGRVGDTVGRRRMFLVGLTVFLLASAGSGLAPSADALVAWRLVQGVGAGILNPQVVGFIQQLYTGRERARAFGMFGATVGIATAGGPLLGGVLLGVFGDEHGWRSVFLVNVPLGIALLVLAWRFLPRDHVTSRVVVDDGASLATAGRSTAAARRPRLDVVGLGLVTVVVVCLMYPFVAVSDDGERAPWWLFSIAALGAVGFVMWERWHESRGGEVVLPRSLATTRSFTFGAAVGLTYFMGFTSVMLVSTLFLQHGLGLSPLQAGLVQMPFALTAAGAAMLGARLVVRIGRWSVVLGAAASIVGFALTDLAVASLDVAILPWVMAACLMLGGLGNGMVISPNQTLSLSEVPLSHAGTAGAGLQTLQRIGTSIGVPVTTAVFFSVLAGGDDVDSYRRALVLSLRVTVAIVTVAFLIALVDALRRRRSGEAMDAAVG